MMVSERPAATSPTESPTPPPEVPAAVPPVLIPPKAPATLRPSAFLSGFDLVLVLGVIVLGFAIASFAVRNADYWQHLGAGKLIADGKYEFGKDPFSYSTEGRKWINPSWLYDLIVYKIHSKVGGRAVVVFKAIIVAVLAGLLLFARRPGQSLWIGATCVGLALLASAPRMLMDPIILSLLFFGLTICLLVHARRFKDRWSLPAAFAAVFAIWSNCDEWFILGPLTLTFFLLGEFLQQRMQPAQPGDEPLPLRTLSIALAAGVVACMLNPHHIGVWRLPAELQTTAGEILARDAAFAPIYRSAFEKGGLAFDSNQGGNPVNGVAFLMLAGLNVLSLLLLGRQRLSWGFLLVSSGLLALAVIRQRAIPFYAIAAAPITAIQLGMVAQRLKERTYSRGTLQALAGGRAAVRVFLLVAGLIALIAAWPGWLHPLGQHRRLDWNVIPDPSLEKAAQLLDRWRQEGRLPAEARGLILHPDLAAYCAYYAPSEKTYFDARIGLHAPEADSFFKIRQNLMARKLTDPRPPEFDVDKFLTEQRVSFVVMQGQTRQEGLNSFLKFSLDQYRDGNTTRPKWEFWNVAGNASVFGWTRQQTIPEAQRRAMRYNPRVEAFGPDAVPVPDAAAPALPQVGQQSFVDKMVRRFLEVPPEPAADAEEAMLINQHQQIMYERYERRKRGRYLALITACGIVTERLMNSVAATTEPVPVEFHATAVLAVRSARRGIAASPNYPEGYFALAEAYKSPGWYGLPEDVLDLVRVSSLSRYYLRLPPELQANPSSEQALQAARELFQMHDQHGRLDLAADFMRRTLMGSRSMPRPPQLTDEQFQEFLKAFDQELRKVENAVREKENAWINKTARQSSQLQRATEAQGYGLYRKSLQELNAIDTGDSSKLPPEQIYTVLLERIRLNLIVGQAEEAEEIVRMIEEGLRKQQQNHQKSDFDQDAYRNIRTAYRKYMLDTYLVLGQFTEAAKVLHSEGSAMKANLEALMRQPLVSLGVGEKKAALGFPEIVKLWIGHRLCARPGLTFTDLLYAQNLPFYEMILPQYTSLFRGLEELHFRLGMTYLEQGNNAAAAAQFREVVRSATPRMRTQRQNTAQLMLDLLRSK